MSHDKASSANSRITRLQATADQDKKDEVFVHFQPLFGGRSKTPRSPPPVPRDIQLESNLQSLPHQLAGNNNFPPAKSANQPIVESEAPIVDLNITKEENPNTDNESQTSTILNQSLETITPPVMAQTVRLRDTLVAIPEFDGTNIPLEEFLEGCEDAKCMIEAEDEATFVKYIRMKIKGEAKSAIMTETFDTLEDLSTYLKKIFAPSQTVPELLGELGSQYQRDGENVLSFANRIKRLGARVLEAQRVATHPTAVTAEFRNYVNSTIIGCFKRGLKPEIENKLAAANEVAALVQSAITAEREIKAKRLLRNISEPKIMPKPKNVMATFPTTASAPQSKLHCSYCKMTNHNEDKCFKKQRDLRKPAESTCQLCNKPGHMAKQCNTIKICQLCNQAGHTADRCFMRTKSLVNCQVCSQPGHTACDCPLLKRQGEGNKIDSGDVCHYCKKPGHMIADCRKRLFREQKNLNGNPNQSATREGLQKSARSTNCAQEETIDELLFRLIPLESEQ